jgi:hypothetical protein
LSLCLRDRVYIGTGATGIQVEKLNATDSRHFAITGNMVGRFHNGVELPLNTTGIEIKGNPQQVLLVGNDASDTDQPLQNEGSGVLISANLGF